MSRLQANLLLLACAAVWGFAFVFQKRAMEHIGPFTFICLRSVLACAALALPAWMEWRRAERPTTASLPRRFMLLSGLAGVAFFGGAGFQQAGLVTASATNAGFLTALYVILTPFLAWLMLRQQPGARIWMAAGLAFAGTWLLGGGSLAAFARGEVLVTLSALLWALHVILVSLAATRGLAVMFTLAQFAVVALLGAVAAVGFGEIIDPDAMRRVLVDIAYVGLLSSALTFTLLTLAMRATRPAEAAVIMSTESLFAALGGVCFLGDRLPAIAWLGGAAIFAATLIVHLPQRRAPAAAISGP